MRKAAIRKYGPKDEGALFSLMEREGEEWEYWQGGNRAKYSKALQDCITYLIFENGALCGFVRCRDDGGFGVYIFDLLVDAAYRGRGYGRLMMEHVCREFPSNTIYIMSDVDGYYGGKLGYQREGTIFIVNKADGSD
ncbi:MAG: GNAT family N-acetyltransferase [Clostridiales bacterium]|jgi:ribosomal protein S18 acetylase RimI-like enzyme|nr:GNAT family N-acetyltransferase [Clostridiales bacterium]